MGTARVKQEEEHENNGERGVKNMEGRNVGTMRGESAKQRLPGAKDITIELPEERNSPYHRLT